MGSSIFFVWFVYLLCESTDTVPNLQNIMQSLWQNHPKDSHKTDYAFADEAQTHEKSRPWGNSWPSFLREVLLLENPVSHVI